MGNLLFDINRIENVRGRTSKYLIDPTACTIIETKQCRRDNIAYLVRGDDEKIYIKAEDPKKIKEISVCVLSQDSEKSDKIPVYYDEDLNEYYFEPKTSGNKILIEVRYKFSLLF